MERSRLHHIIEGPETGPVLVLGNSLGADTRMWSDVADRLAHRFRILRYDHRGQGRSTLPSAEAADIVAHGTDVIRLLDSQGIDRFHYSGISLGGMVGLWLAAHYPERMASLTAICTSAHPGNGPAWRARARTVLDAGSTAPVAGAVTARWLTPEFAVSYQSRADEAFMMMVDSPPEGYAACCHLLANLDLRQDLGRVRCSVLVVAGGRDEALPPEHSEAIAALIPRSRYEVLSGAAHIPSIECPDELAALLLAHVTSL